jgi:hypothetical protein
VLPVTVVTPGSDADEDRRRVVLAASQVRSSGPYWSIRARLQLAVRRSATGQRVPTLLVQLGVRRDLPMGHEGSNPSEANRRAVLLAGQSFTILRRGRDSNPR